MSGESLVKKHRRRRAVGSSNGENMKVNGSLSHKAKKVPCALTLKEWVGAV